MPPANTLPTGLPATVGVVCLVAAVLLWTVGNRAAPRLVVALTATGSTLLLSTPVGGWLRSIVTGIDATVANLIGKMTGAVVVGLLAGVAAFVLVIHLWLRRVDTTTVVLAAVVPAAVSAIPGPAGEAATTALTATAAAVGWVVAAPFGLV